MALINFTFIGFLVGVVLSFIVWFSNRLCNGGSNAKMGSQGENKFDRRIRKMQEKRDFEARKAHGASFVNSSVL